MFCALVHAHIIRHVSTYLLFITFVLLLDFLQNRANSKSLTLATAEVMRWAHQQIKIPEKYTGASVWCWLPNMSKAAFFWQHTLALLAIPKCAPIQPRCRSAFFGSIASLQVDGEILSTSTTRAYRLCRPSISSLLHDSVLVPPR